MLVHVTAVLTAQEMQTVRGRLSRAAWADGRLTAGYQSAPVKSNLQVPQSDPDAQEASGLIVTALERNATFLSATLPHHVYPPLFNRYTPGMGFGDHIDNAVRQVPGTPHRLRTDISATLFLNAPEEYDGGELVIDDLYGTHAVKLAAGDMVVYPASSLHRVQAVTRGARDAAFFWIQSMVRDDGARALLYELDLSIREFSSQGADARSLLRLTGCYHNLIRRWADL
ncbi:MAG TPA: Fe2+-dependent dioxygenase [Steroidobacteraceae bacterium]|jgi:PKHD-type hydroxylase|nr:Fe2+-dependent dioxygenase [Steroidobacteraceae bacterium]